MNEALVAGLFIGRPLQLITFVLAGMLADLPIALIPYFFSRVYIIKELITRAALIFISGPSNAPFLSPRAIIRGGSEDVRTLPPTGSSTLA
jgi:hypothetical protein